MTGKRWILAPLLVAACWLALTAVPAFTWTRFVMAWIGFAYLPLLWAGLIAVRVRSEHDDATYLAAFAHAPFGLIPAWFRNDEALLGWLHAIGEDPSFELVSGGIALFVCATLPVALAWRAYVHGASRALRVACFGVYLVAWLAVLNAFDAYMFFGGVLSFCGLLWFSVGALCRVIVLIALLAFALRKPPAFALRKPPG